MPKDLKQLRITKQNIEDKLALINKELASLNKEKTILINQLHDVNSAMTNLSDEVVVTDHAVIRYFERVLGYDINTIRSQILPDAATANIEKIGNCEYPVDNFRLVVQNNKVVTVLT